MGISVVHLIYYDSLILTLSRPLISKDLLYMVLTYVYIRTEQRVLQVTKGTVLLTIKHINQFI